MDIVTLGMFIIDEIHFEPPREPEENILGGAGSWAVVGARLFRQPPLSKRVGWTVHRGSDFPAAVENEIHSWQTSCNFVDTPHRLTTRGWNKYGNDEERAFKYTTEKLRIDETQLTEDMLLSRCFHLICSPIRCINLVEGILNKRRKLSEGLKEATTPPMFVWEPVPDITKPKDLEDLLRALKYVDVVSPNHQELATLFGEKRERFPSMEDQCSELLKKGFEDREGAVVVRCGERGCYIATAKATMAMPAYHQDGKNVVDPTGAGNAYLGAFGIGLVDEPSDFAAAIRNGAVYGSVAASFAVEQVGLPKLSMSSGRELWNGTDVSERLDNFRARIE